MTLSRVIYGTESRDDDTAAVMKNIFMMNDKNLRGWVGGGKKKNDLLNFTLSLSDTLKNKPDI